MSGSIPKKKLLGSQHETKIAEYLRAIGDDDSADSFVVKGGTGQSINWPFMNHVWGYTGLLIGFLPPSAAGSQIDIANAMTLPSAPELRGSRVKITLERFWVHKYPGSGEHTVLCEFTGKNQIPGEAVARRLRSPVGVNFDGR